MALISKGTGGVPPREGSAGLIDGDTVVSEGTETFDGTEVGRKEPMVAGFEVKHLETKVGTWVEKTRRVVDVEGDEALVECDALKEGVNVEVEDDCSLMVAAAGIPVAWDLGVDMTGGLVAVEVRNSVVCVEE